MLRHGKQPSFTRILGLTKEVLSFLDDESIMQTLGVNKTFNVAAKHILFERNGDKINLKTEEFLRKILNNPSIITYRWNTNTILKRKNLSAQLRIELIRYFVINLDTISSKSLSFTLLACTSPELMPIAYSIVFHILTKVKEYSESELLFNRIIQDCNSHDQNIRQSAIQLINNIFANLTLEQIERALNTCIYIFDHETSRIINRSVINHNNSTAPRIEQPNDMDFDTLIKLCGDSDESIRENAIRKIRTIFAQLNHEQACMILCLTILLCNNNKWRIRDAANDTLDYIVKIITPEQASVTLNVLINSYDEDNYYIINTISRALSFICIKLDNVDQINLAFNKILQLCDYNDQNITTTSIGSIYNIFNMLTNSQVCIALDKLIELCNNGNFYIKKAASVTLKKIMTKLTAEQACSSLDKLLQLCTNRVWKIKTTASQIIINLGNVLKTVDLQQADYIFTMTFTPTIHPRYNTYVLSINIIVLSNIYAIVSSERANMIFDRFIQLCTHNNFRVRKNAVQALGNILSSLTPEQSLVTFNTFINICKNSAEDYFVIDVATKNLGLMPEYASRSFATLMHLSDGQYGNLVRKSASHSLGNIIAKLTLEQSSMVIEKFILLRDHDLPPVRGIASQALYLIFTNITTAQTTEVFETINNFCSDTRLRVRNAASETIRKIIPKLTATKQIDKALNTSINLCNDENPGIRISTIIYFGNIFPLLNSHQITVALNNLIQLCNDPESVIQETATITLGNIFNLLFEPIQVSLVFNNIIQLRNNERWVISDTATEVLIIILNKLTAEQLKIIYNEFVGLCGDNRKKIRDAAIATASRLNSDFVFNPEITSKYMLMSFSYDKIKLPTQNQSAINQLTAV